MYTILLSSVGNPDFNQWAPISDPKIVRAETLREIRDAVEQYITENDLGGGNWPEPVVYQGDVPIGRFSYNRRLWSIHKSAVNPHGCEITFG